MPSDILLLYTDNGLTANGIEGHYINNYGTIGIDKELVEKTTSGESKYKLKSALVDCGKGSIWR